MGHHSKAHGYNTEPRDSREERQDNFKDTRVFTDSISNDYSVWKLKQEINKEVENTGDGVTLVKNGIWQVAAELRPKGWEGMNIKEPDFKEEDYQKEQQQIEEFQKLVEREERQMDYEPI